jgi:hypothetical protein
MYHIWFRARKGLGRVTALRAKVINGGASVTMTATSWVMAAQARLKHRSGNLHVRAPAYPRALAS